MSVAQSRKRAGAPGLPIFSMNENRFKLNVPGDGAVKAVVVTPDDPGEIEGGLVVAHGQMNDLDLPLLAAYSEGLAERGYASIRFNFPYRERGENVPDGQEILMAALREARDELDSRIEAPIYLAGKSLGARVASLVAKADKAPGLIFLGYPIHAPGGEPRSVEHLIEIEAPMLFFVGTRDPFCDVNKLHSILEKREHTSSVQIVDGGGHSFELPDGDDRPQEIIFENIAEVTADWLDEYGL